MLNNLNLKFVKQNCQLKHKYFVYNYKFHLTMTSHLRRFSAAASTFSQHIHRMRILMLEMCWCHFNKLALKLQIKTAFQQIWYIYLIMLV